MLDESLRRSALGVFLLFSLSAADCGEDPDHVEDPALLVGSVWSFSGDFTETKYSLATRQPIEQGVQLRSQVHGLFRVTDQMNEALSNEKRETYGIELISGRATVGFHLSSFREQLSGSNIVTECDAIGDEFSVEIDPQRSGGDYSFGKKGESFLPDMFGLEQAPTRLFTLQPGYRFPASLEYRRRCVLRDVVYGFSSEELTPLLVTVPFAWGSLPVREGTFSAVYDQGLELFPRGVMLTANLTLACVSGCDRARGAPSLDPAPKPESEQCDQAALRRRCDEFRSGIEMFCKTLEDWVVVYSDSEHPEPQFTCASGNCEAEAEATRNSKPWVGVTQMLDSACEGPRTGELVCSVECYGFSG